MRGKFITLEGGEGCGKSTQAGRLKEALVNRGIEVILTREPGGTPLAEKIRSLLKDENGDPPCDRSELLLFLAARAQLVRNVIRPALAAGKWVVSDRFSDSTLAYQGYGRGLPLDFLIAANSFACEELKSDLTLLLDVPPEIALRRMRSREAATGTSADRIELAGAEFHARLRRGFLDLAAAEKDRFDVIDASGSEDEVWEKIWKSTKRFL
ncbi:MAG: dTMP kinase [Kiritimatiellae bacterium]|jgi:dTMP kinase|nr:dTMP kinase [Kiritimatiellia bacterium]